MAHFLHSYRAALMIAVLFIAGFTGAYAQQLPRPNIRSAQPIINQNNGYYDIIVNWGMDYVQPVPDAFMLVAHKKATNGTIEKTQYTTISHKDVQGNAASYMATFPINVSEGDYTINLVAQYGNYQSDSSGGMNVRIGTTNGYVLAEFTSATEVVTWLKESYHKVQVRISTDNGNTWTSELPQGWKIQHDFTGDIASYTHQYSFDSRSGDFNYFPNQPGRFQGFFTVINEKGLPVSSQYHMVEFRVVNCSTLPGAFYGQVTSEHDNAAITEGYVIAIPENSKANDSVVVAKINPNGGYLLYVDPGKYHLYCSANGYDPEFYGDIKDYALSKPFTIACGDTTKANFVLGKVTLPQVYTVSGMVTDYMSQQPIAFASVTIMSEDLKMNSGIVFSTLTDGKGSYTLTVPEGKYIVHCGGSRNSATQSCYVDQYYQATTDRTQATVLAVNADMKGIDFALTPCTQEKNLIVGIVTDSKNKAIASAVVAFRLPDANEGLAGISIRSSNAQDGSFRFEKLKPGNYVLFAFPTGVPAIPGFYKQNDFATLEWQKATVVEVTSSSSAQLVIKLQDLRSMMGKGGIKGWVNRGGGTIKADDVQGAEPVNGAIAYAIDENGEVRDFALTNEQGLFELSSLNKGKYTLHIERVGYTPSVSEVVIEGDETVTEVTKQLAPAITTGIDENEVSENTAIIPNPANNSATVHFSSLVTETVTIGIYDMMGKLLSEKSANVQTGNNDIVLNTSGLFSGAYMVRVETGSGIIAVPMKIVR